MMTRSYLVVYEKGANNWSGYSPQVLGCASVGDTLEEMRAMMTEALEFHLGNMALDGDPIPEATDSTVDFSEETLENGVECCYVEWLTVRISPEFAGTPVTGDMPAHDPESNVAVYAGTAQTAPKHP